jgi:hypothetical protein
MQEQHDKKIGSFILIPAFPTLVVDVWAKKGESPFCVALECRGVDLGTAVLDGTTLKEKK